MRCQTKRNCPFCGEGFKAIYPLLNHVVCSHEDEDPSHLVPESIVKNAAEGIKKFLVLQFIVSPRYSPTFIGPPTIFDVKSLRHLDRYLLLLIASLLQIFT